MAREPCPLPLPPFRRATTASGRSIADSCDSPLPEPLMAETLRVKAERHWLVQGSDLGSGGLVALSETGG